MKIKKIVIFLSITSSMCGLQDYMYLQSQGNVQLNELYKAKQSGDFDKVQSILYKNLKYVTFFLEYIFPDHETLLMFAARRGNFPFVKYLINADSNPDDINLTPDTPEENRAQFLVKAFSEGQVNGLTALYVAVEQALLLAKKGRPIDNHLDVVEQLIRSGASTNVAPQGKPIFSELIKKNSKIESRVREAKKVAAAKAQEKSSVSIQKTPIVETKPQPKQEIVLPSEPAWETGEVEVPEGGRARAGAIDKQGRSRSGAVDLGEPLQYKLEKYKKSKEAQAAKKKERAE